MKRINITICKEQKVLSNLSKNLINRKMGLKIKTIVSKDKVMKDN